MEEINSIRVRDTVIVSAALSLGINIGKAKTRLSDKQISEIIDELMANIDATEEEKKYFSDNMNMFEKFAEYSGIFHRLPDNVVVALKPVFRRSQA